MSISFNGSSTKLTLSGAVASGFPLTIFGWVKPASASVSQMAFGSANFGGDDEVMAYIDGAGTGNARAFARKDGGSVAASSGATISTAWQPVMVVFTSVSSRTVYYAGGASGSDTADCSNALSSHNRFVIGCRGKDDTLFFSGDIAEVAVWNSALGSTEWATLSGGATPESVSNSTLFDSWSLINATSLTGTKGRTLTATSATNGGTHPITRSGSGASTTISATAGNAVGSVSSKPVPRTAISATTANIFAAWSSYSGSSSSSVAATTGAVIGSVASVGSTTNGTFTSEVLKANNGTVLASKALNYVAIYNDTTGALVVRKTGISTNGSGVFSFSDAALTAGMTYRADWETAEGHRRMPRKAAT